MEFPAAPVAYQYGADFRGTVHVYRSGSAKISTFLQPQRSLVPVADTPSFIIYNLNILSRKKQEMSQSFSNNINSLNTTVNLALADGRSNILAWLSPLDPKLRHQDIRDRRVENVGEWVLQTEQFRRWNADSARGESDKAVLFCFGDPGVGKTFIR